MKISTAFNPADRYLYDNGFCSYENGFAQLDSRQDASYYGQWVSAERLMIVSYAEGDVTIKTADSAEEFVAEMRRIEEWHRANDGQPCRIDPGFSSAMKAAFEAIGLGDMLH